jgi:AraC family transcriptional regulator
LNIINTFIKNIDQREPTISELSPSKILISNLDDYYNQVTDSPISVKIVTNGTEAYKVNNKRYRITSNKYLIVNRQDEFEVEIKSTDITKGICIYPPEKLINEVYNYRIHSKEKLLDTGRENNDQIRFTQKTHALNANKTGALLSRYIRYFSSDSKTVLGLDFNSFYQSLAEHLVDDQLIVEKQLMNFNSSKKQTKEELYRRISLTKDYIHDNFKERIIIEDLAAIACLSKYHFLRSFKDFYKCTPYQYVLKLKLNEARKLRAGGYSYPQICGLIGFSDPKNLQKAIKKSR